jgi:hypothetical protein
MLITSDTPGANDNSVAPTTPSAVSYKKITLPTLFNVFMWVVAV